MAIITGNGGANTINGTVFADLISGLGGNDTIQGFGGNDYLDGGSGFDTASFAGSSNGVYANLGYYSVGNGYANGLSIGVDGLHHFEALIGTRFSDTLIGDANNNVLIGGGGNDTLKSFFGSDALLGDGGNDLLDGGPGNDLVVGGPGGDALIGGGGSDTFLWNPGDFGVGGGADAIRDFSSADIINLRAVDANAILGGNQNFSFRGYGAFTAPGQVHVRLQSNYQVVEINTDFDSAAEGQISMLNYGATINAGDFIL